MGNQGLVPKDKAVNAVKHVFGQGLPAVLAAIRALEPVAEPQDPVSREAVRVMLFEAGGRVYGPKTSYDVLHRKLKDLPPACTERHVPKHEGSERVLPAGRSEEEIRVLDFAVKIARVMKEISSSHVYFILQQAFGEELDWSEATKILSEVIDFIPPKNRKGETGGKD